MSDSFFFFFLMPFSPSLCYSGMEKEGAPKMVQKHALKKKRRRKREGEDHKGNLWKDRKREKEREREGETSTPSS